MDKAAKSEFEREMCTVYSTTLFAEFDGIILVREEKTNKVCGEYFPHLHTARFAETT